MWSRMPPLQTTDDNQVGFDPNCSTQRREGLNNESGSEQENGHWWDPSYSWSISAHHNYQGLLRIWGGFLPRCRQLGISAHCDTPTVEWGAEKSLQWFLPTIRADRFRLGTFNISLYIFLLQHINTLPLFRRYKVCGRHLTRSTPLSCL